MQRITSAKPATPLQISSAEGDLTGSVRPFLTRIYSPGLFVPSTTVPFRFAIVRVYRYFITPLSESIINIFASRQTTMRLDFNTRCEYTVNSRNDTLIMRNENKKAFLYRSRVRSDKVYIFQREKLTFSFFLLSK